MYNVLLLTQDPQMLCQIPKEWKSVLQIDLSPVEGRLYDYCFCYEKVQSEVTFLLKKGGKSIFIPAEPKSIKSYGTYFLQQFDNLFTHREDLPLRTNGLVPPNLIKPTSKFYIVPWRVGLSEKLERSQEFRTIRSVEEILSKPINKSKLLSIVVSGKSITPMQRARIKLVQSLINRFHPGIIDFYGRGLQHPLIKEIDDKAEALDDYMFSIAIENSQDPGYITEKLTDCFITGTVPLYCGAPNYECFYHTKGILPIDIWCIESILAFIEQVILKYGFDIYKELLPSVLSNRHRVIYQTSIIALIYNTITKLTIKDSETIQKTLNPDTVGYFY